MIAPAEIRRMIGPLRMIFWGALFWFIDIKLNNFDILNDVIGAILVAIGVSRLARIDGGERYRRTMRWVKLIAIASVPVVIYKQLGMNWPWLSLPLSFFWLAQLAAMVAFCVAMRWLCVEAGLERSAKSWQVTIILMIGLLAGPLGLLALAGVVTQLFGGHFNLNIGAAVLLVLVVMLAPVAHFFVSTSRMKREAKELAAGGAVYTGQGFPVVPVEPGVESERSI